MRTDNGEEWFAKIIAYDDDDVHFEKPVREYFSVSDALVGRHSLYRVSTPWEGMRPLAIDAVSESDIVPFVKEWCNTLWELEGKKNKYADFYEAQADDRAKYLDLRSDSPTDTGINMTPVFVCERFDFYSECDRAFGVLTGKDVKMAVAPAPTRTESDTNVTGTLVEKYSVFAAGSDCLILAINPDVVFGYEGARQLKGAKGVLIEAGWFAAHCDGGTLTDSDVKNIIY